MQADGDGGSGQPVRKFVHGLATVGGRRRARTADPGSQLVIVFAVTLAVITYIDRVCISQAAPIMQRELRLSDKQMALRLLGFHLRLRRLRDPRGLARRLDRTSQGADAGRRHVVGVHRGHRLGLESGVSGRLPLLVRRRRGGLFSELDEGLHAVAAVGRAGAGAGHHVAGRAMGRRVHPAAGRRRFRPGRDGAGASRSSEASASSGRCSFTSGFGTIPETIPASMPRNWP